MLALITSALAGSTDRTQEPETYWQMWEEFHARGDRFLPDILNAAEHDERFTIFKDNVDKITKHNEKKLSWRMGVTPFADMTPKEFKNKVIGSYCEDNFQSNAKLNMAKTKLREGRRRKVEDVKGEDMVDWRTTGKVTAVKNQQQCGSCWAFSTTGSMEARSAIHADRSPDSLSEQELVDCDENDNGCEGGAMQNGFNYAIQHGGLCLESAYSYTAADGTCKSSSCSHKDKPVSYQDVSAGESYLEAAVADGPVSVAIEADQMDFQLYTEGVYDSTCGTQLDHGVLIVGYNNNNSGGAYWIMKNSWGSSWGESGYMRMCKDCNKNGSAGQCGVASDASYPTY